MLRQSELSDFLLLGRREICRSGTIQDSSKLIKPRTMTWTVPCFLDSVPPHDTSEVRTNRRHPMNPRTIVAKDSDFTDSFSNNGARVRLDIVKRLHIPACQPIAILSDHIDIFFYVF